jgi:hypothetical protein
MEKSRVADVLEEIAVLPDGSLDYPEEVLRALDFGVAVARTAGLRASDVLNALPADRLDAALARGR